MIMSDCHRSQESEAEGVVGDARCQWEAGSQTHIFKWEARFSLWVPAGGQWALLLGDTAKPATNQSPGPGGLIKSGPRPLTSHLPDPQDTTQRPTDASDAGPGMVRPLCQASCGLHSLLNPSSSRNVPASVKSGLSSCVCSRQSPADATCSALVRTARSNGRKHLGRAPSQPGTAMFPVPCRALPSALSGEKQSRGQGERSGSRETGHGLASCSQG